MLKSLGAAGHAIGVMLLALYPMLPVSANAVTQAHFSCAPDETVILSFNLSSASPSSAEIYDIRGTRRVWATWPGDTPHYLNSGLRSVAYSKITTDSAVTFAGYGCA